MEVRCRHGITIWNHLENLSKPFGEFKDDGRLLLPCPRARITTKAVKEFSVPLVVCFNPPVAAEGEESEWFIEAHLAEGTRKEIEKLPQALCAD